MDETEDYDKSATPSAHKTSHQDGGSDEISVASLSGLLADGQTPLAHKTSHQLAGSDAISVAGLSGLLATAQTPIAHKTSHQLAGSDAISVAGLSGLLADGQTPLSHKTSHQLSGSDAISVAGLSGQLADSQPSTQEMVVGLKATDSPVFTTVKCSGLADGYLPYHVSDTLGLANSLIYTDGTQLGFGVSSLTNARLTIKEALGAGYALKIINRNENRVWAFVVDSVSVDDGIFSFIDVTAGSIRFMVDTNGNFGVRMVPVYAFDIWGNLRCGTGFGCNGAIPQTAYASGEALAAYVTGAFGLNSEANMSALHALVVKIRAALVANGIMS